MSVHDHNEKYCRETQCVVCDCCSYCTMECGCDGCPEDMCMCSIMGNGGYETDDDECA
jgi:hypothetical protein